MLAKNLGPFCSIDETMLCDEVYTILSNKSGHGRHGSFIAAVRGTKAEVVSKILMTIPEEERAKVMEVTMDFSDSMYAIVKRCFPNATIVIDCFHIVQRLCESLDEMRLRFKRLAVTETKKDEARHKQHEDKLAKQRRYNHKWYAKNKASKNVNGKKRGRKGIRRKRKFRPQTFSNGDTKIELLTRARTLLYKSGDKWGKNQKERARILFEKYPRLREGYSLICKVRCIFKKDITREQAKAELHKWYEDVAACTIREIKSARDCIKAKEEEVLNFFINRHTNASAESLNSKMKGFKAQLHGIEDIPFFMYRLCTIFG